LVCEVQVGVRVGVHVVRGAAGCGWVVLGAVVLGAFFVDVLVVDFLDGEVVVGEVFVGDGLVEVGRGVLVSLISWIGRSSTGGGADGAAATRNPRRTRRGTQSMTARRIPSRPMRRRGLDDMTATLGMRDEPCMSAG
jgi:hypothetical protein